MFSPSLSTIQILKRSYSKLPRVKPKLRPKSEFKEETLTTNGRIRLALAIGIFTCWFSYISIDLIKQFYGYVKGYREGVVKEESLSETIVIKLPFSFGKKDKQTENDWKDDV